MWYIYGVGHGEEAPTDSPNQKESRAMTPEYITIKLSPNGKNAGKYIAIVSEEDADLGAMVWNVHKTRHTHYAQSKKYPSLHRMVLAKMLERELLPEEQVDHINGLGWDNRRENLRLATRSENSRNRRLSRQNTSGYKGVSWDKREKKWSAYLKVNKKFVYFKFFTTREAAYAAVCEVREQYHKEFTNHGIPKGGDAETN
jgi:hypothetical protein